MADLPGVFGTIAPVLDQYGYLALGGFVLLEDFGVPLPGETILIAAAVYAGTGRLNIIAVVLIALVAAVIGDNIGYAIGHYGGRRLVLRWGRYVRLTDHRLGEVEDFMRRRGAAVVIIARFIEGLRQLNGIVAGTAEMPWARRFLPFNIIGATLWVGVWATVGYLAGDHIDVVYDTIRGYLLYVLIAAAVIILALIARRLIRRRSASAHTINTTDTTTGNSRPSSRRQANNRSEPAE